MRRAYAAGSGERGHPLAGWVVGGAALVAAAAAWSASVPGGVLAAAAVWVAVGRTDRLPARSAAVLLAVGGFVGWRAGTAWEGLTPDRLGVYQGWAELVDDPQPFGAATRVVLEIEGERFEMWARGRALRQRVERWNGGDLVRLNGTRVELDGERRQRVAAQHVVGEFEYDWAADEIAGGPLARASNRVRATIERGAAAGLGEPGQAALFRGLVIGDDREQPLEMINRFRASGLSHLTAVSGQNVAFVLAAAGPVLYRLGPIGRWAATIGLIGWFVALTRFEPSIVRAGAMAAISATGFLLGRARSPARMLWLAVVALLAIDPLLVHAVGFVLSVGATAGVALLGPPLARRLQRLGPLALPVGITLGAQLGVALPALALFGQVPLVSLPCNVLAVPVAGVVMLYGLPAGLLAGAVPALAPVVLFPCRLGVRWVDTVAALGARLEPGGAATWWGWSVVALGAAWLTVPGALGERVEAGE
jgi:competence protein ComEC